MVVSSSAPVSKIRANSSLDRASTIKREARSALTKVLAKFCQGSSGPGGTRRAGRGERRAGGRAEGRRERERDRHTYVNHAQSVTRCKKDVQAWVILFFFFFFFLKPNRDTVLGHTHTYVHT